MFIYYVLLLYIPGNNFHFSLCPAHFPFLHTEESGRWQEKASHRHYLDWICSGKATYCTWASANSAPNRQEKGILELPNHSEEFPTGTRVFPSNTSISSNVFHVHKHPPFRSCIGWPRKCARLTAHQVKHNNDRDRQHQQQLVRILNGCFQKDSWYSSITSELE